MEDIDIITQHTSGFPLWVQVFSGIMLALGGLEFIKWAGHHIANWRAERQKNSAEAKQEEAVAHQQAATAGQQDADWRQKELELMTSIVSTTKQQYEDLARQYNDMKVEKEEDRKIKLELRKELGELKLDLADQKRIVGGLQKAFTESETQRKKAERLYCSDEACHHRVPPLGTYSTDVKIIRTAKKTANG
ncbi:MAG: hypothetical protein II661_09870 [Bacteroidales bacterium]|nr:hypothetical protein [Bacteroidales bacterium]